MTPKVEVTGDALGLERFAILESNTPLPPRIFEFSDVYGSKYHARIRLVPPLKYENGILCSPTQPDFVKLGLILDCLRDHNFIVDLNKVPGWHNRNIGS